MNISRAAAPASKNTFTIAPIKRFLNRHVGREFFEPFPYPFIQDALEMMAHIPDRGLVGHCVVDPPYSDRQLVDKYKAAGGFSIMGNPHYWKLIKAEIARIMKPGNKVITMGWTTTGIGMRNGFYKTDLLIVNHGAQHSDTLILLEKRAQVIY